MKKIVTLICLLGSLNLCSQTTYYVKTSGVDANSGTASWSNAFKTLQKALASAVSGDQIWVAKGTYYPDEGNGSSNDNNRTLSFNLKSGVAIYGGFAGSETELSQRNWKINVTILSGEIQQDNNISNNALHVVQSNGVASTTILDGFTITAGNANGNASDNSVSGGGLYNYNAAFIRVVNCNFSQNYATGDGGGMFNNGSSGSLTNCSFSQNNSKGNGGGISSDNSRLTLVNCSFSNNGAGASGGGIANLNCSIGFINCSFSNNRASSFGGGLLNINTPSTLYNCSFSQNIGLTGGGVYNHESTSSLTNCILWKNNINQIEGDAATVNYSIVQGGYTGTGNLNTDPLFVDAVNDNLHLQPCSPAIDAGDNNGASTTDLDGNPRWVNDNVDMGAYEFQNAMPSPAISTQPSNQSVVYGSYPDPVFSVVVSGTVSGYQWQLSTNAGSSWNNIAGATAFAYTVTSPTVSMSGYQYRVVVSGCNTTVTSNAATLTVVLPPPSITSLSPGSGLPGSSVTITGTNFSSSSTVNIGGVNAVVSASSATQLKVTVPGGVSAGANAVVVKDNGQSSNTATFTVLLSPTLTFNNIEKTYGDASFALSATSNSPGAITYSVLFGSGATVTPDGVVTITGVDSVIIRASQTPTENYTAGGKLATLLIKKAPVTVTALNQTKPYGQAFLFTGSEFTSSGLKNGETIGSVSFISPGAAAVADVAGSPYTIVASNASGGSFDENNYSISYASGTLAVTPKALTINAAGQNKLYDGNTFATVTLSDNRISGDVFTAAYTAAFDDKNVGAGKTVRVTGISISGTDAGNYTYNTTAQTTAAITVAPLTIAATGSNKVYDGTTAATVTLAPIPVGGDVVTLAYGSASFSDKKAGVGKTVTVSSIAITGGKDADNYSVSNTTASTTATITPLAISGSITAGNKVYDGTTTATITGYSLAGAITGDNVSLTSRISIPDVASFNDKNVGTDKTVTAQGLRLTGTDAGNYTVNTTATTAAAITPLEITGSFTAANKAYDGTVAATIAGRFVSGQVDGDAVSLTGGTAAFTYKNVGTGKTVTATGLRLTGEDAGNYTVNNSAATTATITPRSLTAGITANNKTYDGTAGATVQAGIPGGLVTGDDVIAAAVNGAFDNKNAGSGKTVTAGIAITGADAGNYAVNTTATTIADITKKKITVVNVTASNKIYDGNIAATLNTATMAVSRLIAGDVVTAVAGTASFVDRNVGANKTVTATGFTITGADAGNYDVAQPGNLTASIQPRSLAVRATGVNKAYDGNTNATVTLSGDWFRGDILTLTYAAASFSDKNAGVSKTVSVTGISISGIDARNYRAAAATTTTADITPKTITVFPVAATKQYSDPDPVFSYTYSPGLISGDVFSGSLSRVSGEVPGGYPIKQGTLTLSSNYILSFVISRFSAALTITQEDADVAYSGKTYFSTASTTSATATVTLTATVKDVTAVRSNPKYDAYPGNISNATVTFHRDSPTGAILGTTNVPVVRSGSDPKVGTASTTFTYTLSTTEASNSQGISFSVYPVVGENNSGYYQGSNGFNAISPVVTVATPGSQTVHGGGYLKNIRSFGTYAGTAGANTNFGFTMRWTQSRSAVSAAGQATIILLSNGKTYQIKSNTISTLRIGKATRTSKQADFTAKATLIDITNPLLPVAVAENLTLAVNMNDVSSSGTGDQVSILIQSGSTILFSSNWNGTKTVLQNIGPGGNIQVNSSTVTTTAPALTGPNRQPEEVAAGKLKITAIPNPSTAQFLLKLESNQRNEISLMVVNALGKLIEIKPHLTAEQTVQLGSTYRPGIYYVQVVQGHKKEQVKLIKLPN